MLTDFHAHEVLRQYPALLVGNLISLGNHGGFSGARLWRVDAGTATYCLKALPADGCAPAVLLWIHHLLAQAARLHWMPRVLPTCRGESFVTHQGRMWEVQTWLPGVANFASSPSPARLRSACAALAELHHVWSSHGESSGVCPAIQRRWESWQRWRHLLQTGWRPTWHALDPYACLAESLMRLVQNRIDDVPRILTPWLDRPVPLQPCVCDLWHDHILFTGEKVSGLIDFASVKIDNVAVDLARMLGSLIGGGDDASRHVALSAYEAIRPLSTAERALARDLDRTGIIVAATHWLRWLYHDGRRFDHPGAVLGRLQSLRLRFLSS